MLTSKQAYGLQFSVTATRFGTYSFAKSRWKDTNKFVLAAISGALGGIAGNPFFAIKTRMQVYSTSSSLAVGTQHAPLGLFASLKDIYSHEGLRGYFRGLDAFLPRVMIYGATQLSSYDFCQARFRSWGGPSWLAQDGFPQHVTCGVFAALCSVTAMQPFDFIAVRMQNQAVDPKTGHGLLYSSPWECARKSVELEGWGALFKGYRANATRFGPYTVLVFVLVEQFRKLVYR